MKRSPSESGDAETESPVFKKLREDAKLYHEVGIR